MLPADVCAKPGEDSEVQWKSLLKRTKMAADKIHTFDVSELGDVGNVGNVTHLRLSIYPDGGVSRIRLFGVAVGEIRDEEEMKVVSKY